MVVPPVCRAFRFDKFVAGATALLLVCLLPRLASAQAVLPTQWMYGQIGAVESEAYSPDGTLIAIGGHGGVEIYTVATGAARFLPTAAISGVDCVTFSPDGKTLAVAGGNNNLGGGEAVLELWTVATGQLARTLATTGIVVTSAEFSSDSTTLVDTDTAGSNSTLEIWTAATGHLVRTINTGTMDITAVAISPDGTKIAGGGTDYGDVQNGVVQTWTVATGGELTSYPTGAVFGVNSVAFSPDGTMLADAGQIDNGGYLELWTVSAGQLISTLPTSANYDLYSVAFSPDGKSLADGGESFDGMEVGTSVLELWTLSTDKLAFALDSLATDGVISVSFSPNSTMLADGGYGLSGGVLETWTTATGQSALTVSTGFGRSLSSVAFSPNGNLVADGGESLNGGTTGALELWSLSTDKLEKLSTKANSTLNSLAFSADSKTLAVGGVNINTSSVKSGLLELWNTSTGALITTLPTAANLSVQSVAASMSGNVLAVGGWGYNASLAKDVGVLELWNISTGELIMSLPTAEPIVNSVALSPDGTKLVDGGGATTGSLELWDVATGTLIKSFDTSAVPVNAVAFSADGKSFADGGPTASSAVLEVWNVSTGNLLASPGLFPGTTNVETVAFSPDEKVLYVGTPTTLQAFSATNYSLLSYNTVLDMNSFAIQASGIDLGLVTANGQVLVAPNPYYVPLALTSFSVSPSTVVGGTSSRGTATLNGPAPTGGAVIKFTSNSSSAVPPTQNTVPAGGTTASFGITTSAVTTTTTATLTATYAASSVNATITITPSLPSLMSFTVSPTTVVGGTSSRGTATLSGPAPAGGSIIKFSSNSSSAVPPTQNTVPAGGTTASFGITTSAVTTTTTATLTATYNSTSATANLTITPQLPTLVSFTVSPTTVVGGTSSRGTATLSAPAPTGGAVIKFTSNNSDAVPPSQNTVPPGGTTASFGITTSAVTTTTTATLTATYNNSSQNATLTITPPLPTLVSFTVSPTTVVGGTSSRGTATLSGPAPTGGAIIKFTSNNSNAVPPSQNTVPAGGTTASFSITTSAVSTTATATITATYNNGSLNATLTITP